MKGGHFFKDEGFLRRWGFSVFQLRKHLLSIFGAGRTNNPPLIQFITRKTDQYGRFPKYHNVFLGRDLGTLKSDIVSNKYAQLI